MNRGSGFTSLHPGVSFAYFALLVLFAMVVKHPVYLLSLLGAAVALNYLLDRGQEMRRNARWYLLLGLAVFVFNPLFSSRGATILFYLGQRPVTLESLVYGGLFALSLLGILLAFLAYNRVITPDRFLYLFSPLVPKTAFMITVTLRFIPLLRRRLGEIMAVQQTLGALGPEVTPRQRLREATEVLSILVSWSLEASLQTAVSMRARGYGTGPRTSAVVYVMDRRDYFWAGLMVLAAGAVLLGSFLGGWGHLEVFPRLQSGAAWPSWHYVAFVLFLGLPLYLEGRELWFWREVKWKL